MALGNTECGWLADDLNDALCELGSGNETRAIEMMEDVQGKLDAARHGP